MTDSIDFLDKIWGPLDPGGLSLYGEIRAFHMRSGGKVQQHFVQNVDEAKSLASMLVAKKYDVYYGVLPRLAASGTAEDCIKGTQVLWADFDAKNFLGRKTGHRSAFSELANMSLTPHIIVDSGHGYHAYWMLDRYYPFEPAQKVMQGIERKHRSDHCSDAPRILRVPGTINFKGGEEIPVRIVRFDEFSAPYSLDAFESYNLPDRPRAESQYDGTEGWEPSESDAPKFGPGERNNGLVRLAGAMVHKGMSPDDVLTALSWENEARCSPPLMAHEVAAIARSVERYRDE